MTATAAHGSSPIPFPAANCDSRPRRALLAAAHKYAALGWRVLPGPVCDGIANCHPISVKPLGVAEPTVPPERATTDRRVVATWWETHQHAILAPVGDSFEVLRVSTSLACEASALLEERHLGPVALAPSGGYFFVAPGATIPRELSRMRGIELMHPNSLMVLPPSRVLGGVVTWWISPLRSEGKLGDIRIIEDSILKTIPRLAAQ
ncbi:bifunctional DNA primase/polymerase [Amycolatopsis sp. MtRt-6]|uniref:bifunctional DNA primase/polymerase n=1 Tax=Amycolatopsis sp. MtRt-6 TaxID=2792782 RepID=UPI001A8F558F